MYARARIQTMQRMALGVLLVVLASPAGGQQTAATNAGCYCLDNFVEVRFLWNCHDDSTSPGWAICTRPGSSGAAAKTRVGYLSQPKTVRGSASRHPPPRVYSPSRSQGGTADRAGIFSEHRELSSEAKRLCA